MERWRKDGAKDLINVLKRWKPWTPPKPEQVRIGPFPNPASAFAHTRPAKRRLTSADCPPVITHSHYERLTLSFIYRKGFQQGGAFVFARSTDSNGNSKIENLYRFYDPSTGVSAPFDDVLRAAGCDGLDRDVEAVPRELRGSK